MSNRLLGALGDISPRTMRRLTESMRLEPLEAQAPEGAQVPVRLCLLARDGSHRMVDLLRSCSGLAWLRVGAPDGQGRLVRVAPGPVEELLREIRGFRGVLRDESVFPESGAAVELACPFDRGAFVLDARTLRQRLYGGAGLASGSANVDLTRERFLVRLPRGYQPRRPCGLLVWVAAGELGEIPESFDQSLDELGLIAISAAQSGNARAVNDRLQLALDGAATAQARFHIDSRRVYVAGISGGAKVATMTWACFPDVFSGAVAIVGLASYKDTPAGTGGAWPALFAKPALPLFRRLASQRLAAVTGGRDFNHENMLPMAEAMRRDGLQVRVFNHADMGHTLPTAERFREALDWIDEPYRRLRSEETHEAGRRLDAYLAEFGGEAPRESRALDGLRLVMESGPWSEAAWRASELWGAALEPVARTPAKAP